MNSAKARKLQYLLITQLQQTGTVELVLPDGIRLEIGITQEDEFGEKKKTDNYCYVVATRDGTSATLESGNLGIQYQPTDKTLIYEDELFDDKGRLVRTLDVI